MRKYSVIWVPLQLIFTKIILKTQTKSKEINLMSFK